VQKAAAKRIALLLIIVHFCSFSLVAYGNENKAADYAKPEQRLAALFLAEYLGSIDKTDVRKADGTDIVGDEEKSYRQRAKGFLEKTYKEETLNNGSFKKLVERISNLLNAVRENEWTNNSEMESIKEELKSLQKANTELDKTNKGVKPDTGGAPVSISAGSISYSSANLNNSTSISVIGLDGGKVAGKAGIQSTNKAGTQSLAAEGTVGKETSLKLALGRQLPFSKETIMVVALGATNENISQDFSTGNQTFNAKQIAGKFVLVRVPKEGAFKRIQAYLAGSHSGSIDLGTDVKIIETASNFDISDVQKRYAGADVVEFGLGATVDVGKSGELSFGVGQRRVRYDTAFIDAGNTNEMTGYGEYIFYTQSGNHMYKLRYDTSASVSALTGRADFSIDKKHGTTTFIGVVQPLTGTGSTRIEAGVTFPLDAHNNPDLKQPSFVRPGRTPAEGNVAAVTRSALDTLPTSVVGKTEEKTTDVSKIDKTGLDSTTAIDKATGDLLIDVPGATSIASVSPFSSAFVLQGNTRQAAFGHFASAAGAAAAADETLNNKLRVVMRSLAIPAAGTTQNYTVVMTTSSGTRTVGLQSANLNGHLQIEQVINIGAAFDTVPDAFDFKARSDVPLNTAIISAPSTVSGINFPTPITITGGEYSIDGGAWVSTSGSVMNGQTVAVRVLSANLFLANTGAIVTIGGVAAPFVVKTRNSNNDTIPDQFFFVEQRGVPLNTVIISAPITVSGIDAPSHIFVSSDEYSIDGGAWISTEGYVTNGQSVRVRVASAPMNNTETDVILVVGGVSDVFRVRTQDDSPPPPPPADTTPDAFNFTGQTGVPLNTVITSAPITVAGINALAAITIDGGNYSVNGAGWTAAAGNVNNGDAVRVQVTSSAANSTNTSATVIIGGVSDIFTARTLDAAGAPASAPAALTLTNDSGAADGITKTTPLGFSWNSVATATGYDLSTNGGTSWTSLGNVTSTTVAGLADGTYNIQVRATNGSGNGPATASFPVTLDTLAPTWGSWVSAAPNTQGTTYNSLEAALSETLTGGTLTGITSSNGGTISAIAINGSGNATFNFITPNVANTTLTFAGADKAGNAYSVNRPLVLGAGADTTPDAFIFTDQTGVALNTVITSAPITVAGINAATPISIAGGSYSINGAGWTAAAGNVNNGDAVRVQVTSSAANSTNTNATVTIGGVSDIFTARTLDAVPASAPGALTLTNDSGAADRITKTTPLGFSWNAVATATGYDLSTNGGTSWTSIGNVTSTTVAGLADGTYNIQVRATNGSGNGPATASFPVTLDTLAPTWGSWVSAAPNTQGTTYNSLEAALGETLSGGTLTGITSSGGGTISGAAINGAGNITFNFVTPGVASTTLTFTGSDKAGNAFTITRVVTLL
jgi:hypothetical protein